MKNRLFKQEAELPDKPFPIAIIGAGGIVRDAHLPAYSLANFPVLGIYDIDIEKAKSLQKDFPIVQEAYPNLEDLIKAAVQKKAVFDLAVPANHICRVLEQLPEGSAVLIQKPMGETLEEARQIRAMCEHKKLISAVNFQLRYAPYILAVRDIIKQGLIGDVFDMEVHVCVHTPWELWDFLKAKPRLEILYHSIHYLDLIRSFLGDPAKVYASTVKHPKAEKLAATRSTIILDYENSIQARVLTNHGHDYGLDHQQSYLKIEGMKGAIKIKIGLSLDYPNGQPPTMEWTASRHTDGWEKIALIGGWFPHAFIGTMATLQKHVQDQTYPLPCSSNDALMTMKLVEAAYESSEKGGVSIKK